jgi:hypothetical protein
MPHLRKSIIAYGLNKVVTNAEKNYWQYYTVSIITTFLVVAVIDIVVYRDFAFQVKEKEESFLQGAEVTIKNLILHDLKLVYDGVSDSNKLIILKNYSPVNTQKQNTIITGNVLYISRGPEQIILIYNP